MDISGLLGIALGIIALGISGLLGALIAIGILCIIAWAILAIIAHVGVPVPHILTIIVWAVVGIICLLLLAQGLGIAVPGI